MSAAVSSAAMFTFSASTAVPALPGATKTRPARGLCLSFQASACSRPPLPTTRTFIAAISRDEHDDQRNHTGGLEGVKDIDKCVDNSSELSAKLSISNASRMATVHPCG